MGHDELEQLVEGPNGTLVHAASNATYCGSCYGAEEAPGDCCDTCAAVRERYRIRGWAFASAGAVAQCKREGFLEAMATQAGEGCQIYGHIEVNKVAGNFHFAPGKSFQQGAMHVHDLFAFGADAFFNMSHTVNKLSFGADFPGQVNPLDGAAAVQSGGHLMYQYFIKVVPTLYKDIRGKLLRTAQFSVTEFPKPVDILSGRTLPGVFCFYDINPIQARPARGRDPREAHLTRTPCRARAAQVRFAETKSSFTHFLTSVCAIVGGVFTVSGLIDSFLYHGGRALRKKMELGKQG